ncbi:DUF6220 domain-containing protein [Dictyobacter formicarum]|uniref:Uncharacterized protein n=1 Tax=Dictyobacter formicarum TaxID=2778368 RepID=A0ABQ3VTS0_9CHLR|nr:DUF6220 domain-containing protein [Dictyobacter formicarum]GHO89218.1 hypothetical protein KSZ_72240 [Dictyobacter formicarum]
MQVAPNKTFMPQRWTLFVYLTLAGLILSGTLLQGFLIGTSLFADAAWGQTAHSILGMVLLLLTLLLPLVGLLVRLPGRITVFSAVLFVLTLLQVTLAGLARSAPFLAALHPTNAMLMFAVNMYLFIQVWHITQGRQTESAQPQAASAVPDEKKKHSKVPLEINLATGSYLLYALISVAVLTLFILNRPQVANAVRSMHPNFSQSEVDGAVASIQLIVVGAHIVFGSSAAILAFLIRTGKNWARIVSSVVSGLVVLEILYEWSSPTDVPAVLGPNQRIYAVFVQILMIMMVLACAALQWIPQASRTFFAAEKASTPGNIPDAAGSNIGN